MTAKEWLDVMKQAADYNPAMTNLIEKYGEMLLEEHKVANKNFVLADVRGHLIAFLRQQTKLHYVSIYENDFEFADKILKAINLP